jgi:hypothetical protein
MNHRELLLYWSTVGFEILLCGLVYSRNLQRRLPFFTIYANLLLLSNLGVPLVYRHFGFRSLASYEAAWIAAGIVGIARFVAIGELCRFELRAYRGIWALTWRILTLLAVFLLGSAASDAWGQVGGIPIYGLTIERDVAVASIAIVLALLTIRKYYGLTLEPMLMWIAVGMSVISIIDILNNAILYKVFTGPLTFWFFGRYTSSWSGMKDQVESANDLWNSIRTFGFISSISIWCYALRKPLPAPATEPVLLPAEVYRELSPVVNLRLRAFNERLLEILKP